MDVAQALPRTSPLKRVLRWIGDVERALDVQPIDDLELRVARLERRIAALRAPSDAGASNERVELGSRER